jgi:WD40 repeat protein
VLENGKLALWDISTRKVLHILPIDHMPDLTGGGICSIAFSPNCKLLAIGNRNSLAEVWRLRGDRAPVAGRQPIEVDGLPGPWGPAAINGLRTRLILQPVKPAAETREEGRLPKGKDFPTMKDLWWRVQLQVRNETEQNLTCVWPEIRRPNGIVITRDNGQPVAYVVIEPDPRVTRQIPMPVQAHGVVTMNSILLGRNHDMSRPGKYRIEFLQTQAERPLPAEVTNPTLPASNVLEFENSASVEK